MTISPRQGEAPHVQDRPIVAMQDSGRTLATAHLGQGALGLLRLSTNRCPSPRLEQLLLLLDLDYLDSLPSTLSRTMSGILLSIVMMMILMLFVQLHEGRAKEEEEESTVCRSPRIA